MEEPRNEFSSLEIAGRLGIPRERFREWVTRGYIRPSIRQASGPGTRSVFSRWDVYAVALFKHLVEGGLSREEAGVCVAGFTSAPQLPIFRVFGINYLIFRRIRDEDGRLRVAFQGVPTAGEGWKIDVETGVPESAQFPPGGAARPGYDDLLVVNFARLRQWAEARLEA